MNKFYLFLFSTLLVLTGCSNSIDSTCQLTETAPVCYDKEMAGFAIEKDATLKIGVDQDQLGKEIVDLFTQVHPQLKGRIEYKNISKQNPTSLNNLDVAFVSDAYSQNNKDSLLKMDAYIERLVKDNFKNIDSESIQYIPLLSEGNVMIWNVTMLKALGVNTKDENKDYLIDTMDTWDKIFSISKSMEKKRPKYKEKDIQSLYALSLQNTYDLYPLLTASGWGMEIKEAIPTANFDSNAFLNSLEFIQELNNKSLSNVPMNQQITGIEALTKELSPIVIASSNTDLNELTKTMNSELVMSSLPTYKGKPLSTIVESKGIVINKNTKYPSAANEMVRLLLTKEGMTILSTNTNSSANLLETSYIKPYASNTNQQVTDALKYSVPFPKEYSLPNSTNRSYLEIIGEPTFVSKIQLLFNDKTKPKDIQKDLVKYAEDWYTANNK